MNRTARFYIAMVSTALLLGCSTSSIIPTGQDTYMVTASGAGFSTVGVRDKVFKAANDYCVKRGLVMVPISFKANPGLLGRNPPPSADLIFRALKPGDPAIANSTLIEDDHVQFQKDSRVRTHDETTKEKDLYTEILKLDELRKKGLITDAEFAQAKALLLGTQKK
jgi:hypothetical protein